MKNITYTIIMIALLAVAAFLIINPQKVDAPNLDIDTESEVLIEVTPSEDVAEVSYDYSVDLERSEVSWTAGKKFIAEYIDKGTLELLSGGLNITGDSEVNLDGGFVFDMNSIVVTDTGFGGGFNGLERELKSDNFFDTNNYPTSNFTITSLSTDSTNQTIEGDLTIKGITKPIIFALSEWNEMDQYIAGSVNVNRLDYGIDFRSEGLIGKIEDKVINEIFNIDFKIYYSQK
jgi:polyisoprenoid-binding protein YceI